MPVLLEYMYIENSFKVTTKIWKNVTSNEQAACYKRHFKFNFKSLFLKKIFKNTILSPVLKKKIFWRFMPGY